MGDHERKGVLLQDAGEDSPLITVQAEAQQTVGARQSTKELGLQMFPRVLLSVWLYSAAVPLMGFLSWV